MALASFIFLFFYSPTIRAQNFPLYMTWDNAVGCQVSDNHDRKNYFELIADEECLRVCRNNIATYTLETYNGNWENTTWNVVGGQVISTSLTTCQVRWDSTTNTGSIGAIVLTANGNLTLPDLCIEIIKNPKARFEKAPYDFNSIIVIDPKDENIQVCTDEVVFFENGSTDNGGTSIIDYHWDFGDGGTSSAFEPSHVYTQDGTYKITLTVTNACNCESSYSKKIEVGKKGFAIVCPAVVCEGQQATYSLAEGSENCSNFYWSVIGGKITNGSGYNSSIEVDWSSSYHFGSDGFGYVTFTPDGCNTGCYVPTTLKIPIIINKMPIVGDAIVCGNSQQRYTMPKWPTTDFVWEILTEGNTNPSIVLTDQRNEIILNPGDFPGKIILRCTYQNTLLNCGGTSERVIQIKRNATILGVKETCMNSTESYTLDGGLSGSWSLKKLPSGPVVTYTGTTFTTTFATAGNYSLTASGINYCTGNSLIIKVISTATPLIADLSANRIVCPSSPSTFTFTNSVPGTIIGWSIPAGTGTIIGTNYGNEIQVVFSYPIPPGSSYSLTIWRESENSLICKSANLIVPLAPEVLAISPIDGEIRPCGSTSKRYEVPETTGEIYEWKVSPTEAGSIITNGSRIVDVLWNQFAAPKNATLKLKVTKCNIPQSSELAIIIANPIISIVAPQGPLCRDIPYLFTVNATPALNGTTSGAVTWNFGDGTPAQIGTSVYHTYLSQNTLPSNYIVTVSVAHPNACLGTITANTPVTIAVSPVASIEPALVVACTPAEIAVPLTVTVMLGYGTTTSIVWYNQSNVAVTPLNVITSTYTPSTYGSYHAIVSNATCSITTNQSVIASCDPLCVVSPAPVLVVTTTNDCGKVTATGSFTPLLPAPQSISWDSDQVSPSSCSTSSPNCAVFNFYTPGNHVVKYTLNYPVNGMPCGVTKSKVVLVPYVAKIGYTVACGTGATYTITLLDQSLFYAITPIQTWEFLVNGVVQPQSGSDSSNQRTLSLAPGNYTLRLNIAGSGYPVCSKEITLELPALPNPAFTFENNVCVGKATHFATANQPGVTYSWSFGDDTYNLQQNPYREYATATIRSATLRVTNQYGCYRESSQMVTTLINNQNGVIVRPVPACPGGTTTLIFNPIGTPTPVTSYQWLYNNVPIAGATTNPYTEVLASGSYGIVVGNANGCTQRMDKSVAVAIVKPPFSSISGSHFVCSGSPITLSVHPGATSNLQYEWRRSDSNAVLSTDPVLEDVAYTQGVFTYTLLVRTPVTGSGYCTSLLTHEVTVSDPPQITAIYYDEIQCNPYKVKLHAEADTDGVFTWSNGKSGAVIDENQGGVYLVTFISTSGCKVKQSIDVPKSVENYMWIFPYGCYTFCSKFDTASLIGPALVDFHNWQWLKDSVIEDDGINDVEPYVFDQGPIISATPQVAVDPVYNLVLKNEFCELKSQDMSVKVTECSCVIPVVLGATQRLTKPYIHYLLTINIGNPTNSDMIVTLITKNTVGVFLPGSVTVPAGGGVFVFDLLPETVTFSGSIVLKFNSINNLGEHCYAKTNVILPTNSPPSRQVDATTMNGTNLVLIPNPVKDIVAIHYDYGTLVTGMTTSIAIYDMLGRELEHYTPVSVKDSWQLNMSTYQAGQYIVVMRLNGAIVQQKNLMLTR